MVCIHPNKLSASHVRIFDRAELKSLNTRIFSHKYSYAVLDTAYNGKFFLPIWFFLLTHLSICLTSVFLMKRAIAHETRPDPSGCKIAIHIHKRDSSLFRSILWKKRTIVADLFLDWLLSEYHRVLFVKWLSSWGLRFHRILQLLFDEIWKLWQSFS